MLSVDVAVLINGASPTCCGGHAVVKGEVQNKNPTAIVL
jgi:hypothetical protein